MIFKSKHIQTRNSQVEDVSLDSDQISSSPSFILTSNRCSTTRVYPQIVGWEESTPNNLASAKLSRRQNAQLQPLQMPLQKESTLLMLDLLDIQHFAAQAQQLSKKLSSLPDPSVASRSTWCRFVWLQWACRFPCWTSLNARWIMVERWKHTGRVWKRASYRKYRKNGFPWSEELPGHRCLCTCAPGRSRLRYHRAAISESQRRHKKLEQFLSFKSWGENN